MRRSRHGVDGDENGGADWEEELARWIAPLLPQLGHKGRHRWAPVYLRGLLGPGDRKSVQPMAARVAPADHEQLHHFIATSPWDPAPLETALALKAEALVGGRKAVLIIDDTSVLKQGHHSVGVARQYSGQVGKTTNCQSVVSITLARDEVPVAVALRLFLPAEWTRDPERLRRAGVPAAACRARTKGAIALAELDRVRAAGITATTVLADAGYGASAAFRQALSARRLTWAVGIPRSHKVYPAQVVVARPPRARSARGRPRKYGTPSHRAQSAATMLHAAAWRAVTWRTGTRGPLSAHFAARRVRVADAGGPQGETRLPGTLAWLVGERRANGQCKYYLTNHPASTTLRTLAATIKARWVCEQAHQQMKEELGLDHFEGRGWLGFHHHLLFSMLAFAFLQHLRLQAASKKNPTRSAPAPHPSRRPARPPPPLAPGSRAPLSVLPSAHSTSSTTLKNVAK